MFDIITALKETASAALFFHDEIQVETDNCLQFVDLTDQVIAVIQNSGVRDGLVNVQTRHTTTAIIVNENEPLVLEDMKEALERLAPSSIRYRHDDFSIRTVNLTPNERENGHSHCKAMFLRTSETLNIAGGLMRLGRWQRIFLIELDGGRRRTISIVVFGQREAGVFGE